MITDKNGVKLRPTEAARMAMREQADGMMEEVEDSLDRLFPRATRREREAVRVAAQEIYFDFFDTLA